MTTTGIILLLLAIPVALLAGYAAGRRDERSRTER